MTPTVNLNDQLELLVNDGPTLEAYLNQTYGISLLKSKDGYLTVVDLKTKQMWKPRTKTVTQYGQNTS